MGQIASMIFWPVISTVIINMPITKRDGSVAPSDVLESQYMLMSLDTPSSHPTIPAHAVLDMKALDPVTGLGEWTAAEGRISGTANGLHHFDLVGSSLVYNETRHNWTPNGTFNGTDSSNNKRDLSEVSGTWTLLSPEDRAQHLKDVKDAVRKETEERMKDSVRADMHLKREDDASEGHQCFMS